MSFSINYSSSNAVAYVLNLGDLANGLVCLHTHVAGVVTVVQQARRRGACGTDALAREESLGWRQVKEELRRVQTSYYRPI